MADGVVIVDLHPHFKRDSTLPVVLSKSIPEQSLLDKNIGYGKFAKVYQIEYNNKPVAYKKFRSFIDPSENKPRHRTRELELLASDEFRKAEFIVQCRAIVKEKERDEDSIGLLFELMHGDLYHKVITNTRGGNRVDYGAKEMCLWSWQIACGIQFLHERKLIHRDIKPENILITSDLKICKISDLGIVTIVDKTTTFNGTVRFTAPELMQDERLQLHYSYSSDIYSLAITMWYIVHRDQDKDAKFPTLQDASIRPVINETMDVARLKDLLASYWHVDPSQRPEIADVVKGLETKKKFFCGTDVKSTKEKWGNDRLLRKRN